MHALAVVRGPDTAIARLQGRGEAEAHDTDDGGEDCRWQALLLGTAARWRAQAGASVPGDQGS